MDAKMSLILDGNFRPGFRIELHIKDLVNALDTAHAIGVTVPVTSIVMDEMQALAVRGRSPNDRGGLVEFYEDLADRKVCRFL